jgi:hypothetical protein
MAAYPFVLAFAGALHYPVGVGIAEAAQDPVKTMKFSKIRGLTPSIAPCRTPLAF